MSHNLTPREVRAVKALVEEMGLDRKLVLKTYRSLSKLFGRDAAQMIEADNYRALLDAYFEPQELQESLDVSQEHEGDMPQRKLRRRAESNASRNSSDSCRVEVTAQHEAHPQAWPQAEAEVHAQPCSEAGVQAADVQGESRRRAQPEPQRRPQLRSAQTQTSSEYFRAGTQHQQPRSAVSRAAQTQEQFEAGPCNADAADTEQAPQVRVKVETPRAEACKEDVRENAQPKAGSCTRTSEPDPEEAVENNGALEKRKAAAVQLHSPLKKPKLEPGTVGESQRNNAAPSCATPHVSTSSAPEAALHRNGSTPEGKRTLPHTGRPPLSPIQPSPSSDTRRVIPIPSKVPVMRLEETLSAKVKQEPSDETAAMRRNGVHHKSNGVHAEEGQQGMKPVADASTQCVKVELEVAAAEKNAGGDGGGQALEATNAGPEPVEFAAAEPGCAGTEAKTDTGEPVEVAAQPKEVAAQPTEVAAQLIDVAAEQVDTSARSVALPKVKIEPGTAVFENGGSELNGVKATPPHSNCRGARWTPEPVKSKNQGTANGNRDTMITDRKGKGVSASSCVPQSGKGHCSSDCNKVPHLEMDQKGKGLLHSNKSLTAVEELDSASRDVVDTEDGFQHNMEDISCGYERIPIPCINDSTSECLPTSFHYMPSNIIHQEAQVVVNLARISEDNHCSCMGDCLKNPIPCHCSARTGGVYAYTEDGCLRDHFIERHLKKVKGEDLDKRVVYCVSSKQCPNEADGTSPGKCKGHPERPFIKECWVKCRCNKNLCGNRVVQRGVTRRLQVFWTREGKGWGIQTLEDLPKGAFLFEYVGEVLTNSELHRRNSKRLNDSHHYPVTLDSDWVTEEILNDNDALCLDGTYHGNVARFLNHRCYDSNLMDMAVEIETPDHNYYHIAFFTTRVVKANEELTWDYGIDFEDLEHPVKAFLCMCGSQYCRDPSVKSRPQHQQCVSKAREPLKDERWKDARKAAVRCLYIA